MKKGGFGVFIVLSVLLLGYLFLRPADKDESGASLNKPETVSHEVVEYSEAEGRSDEGQEVAAVQVATSDQASGPVALEGKRVAHLKSDEVGHSPESGGIGVAGISPGRDGRVMVWDRFNDAFYLVDELGGKELLYRMSEADEYMKGATLGRDGEFIGLVGNTSLTLIRQGPDGSLERLELGIEPDYLNAFRLEPYGDSVALYGVEENYLVGPDGRVEPFYGALVGDEGLKFDMILNDDQHPVLTIRDAESAPINTVTLNEPFGSVQGVYSMAGGNAVAILESDPFASEENRENPYYTVQIYNQSGEKLREETIPMQPGFPIDQPIAVQEDRLYYTVQHPNGELEVFEYSLRP